MGFGPPRLLRVNWADNIVIKTKIVKKSLTQKELHKAQLCILWRFLEFEAAQKELQSNVQPFILSITIQCQEKNQMAHTTWSLRLHFLAFCLFFAPKNKERNLDRSESSTKWWIIIAFPRIADAVIIDFLAGRWSSFYFLDFLQQILSKQIIITPKKKIAFLTLIHISWSRFCETICLWPFH